MKFYTTTYHSNLIKDKDRLAAFLEGIKEVSDSYNNSKITKNTKITKNAKSNKLNKSDKSTKSNRSTKTTKNNENNKINKFNQQIDHYNQINQPNLTKTINNLKKKKNKKIAFDLGCGSGILSYFASEYYDLVLAMDIDKKIIDCAEKSFFEAEIDNVYFINEDASLFDFSKSMQYSAYPDLIICEMLDTALIDEEEIPVLNNIQKYINDINNSNNINTLNKEYNVKILPKGIINIAEPVFMKKNYIHYEDEEFHGKKPSYRILGDPVKYSEFNFSDDIDPNVETIIDFNLYNSKVFNNIEDNDFKDKDLKSQVNGLKITTFTLITDNIICGPTPMFNPPMFVPIFHEKSSKYVTKMENNKKKMNNEINKEDSNTDNFSNTISVKLEYIMGGGVETIKTKIIY